MILAIATDRLLSGVGEIGDTLAVIEMFCVVCCENSAIWSPIDFIDMFITKLARNPSEWISVNIANNEPLPLGIEKFDGVVFTGSRFNICDRESYPWFENVCEFIRTAARSGKPRIYGGCFGCQLIGHALGGEVLKNPTERFILKAEDIELIQPLFGDMFPQFSVNKPSLKIIASHGYCVAKLPPDSRRIATSCSCVNEMFVTGTGENILACQSHPEFDYDYAIKDRIWPAVVDKFKRLTEEEIEASARSFDHFTGDDSLLLCDLISSFLYSQPSPCSLSLPNPESVQLTPQES